MDSARDALLAAPYIVLFVTSMASFASERLFPERRRLPGAGYRIWATLLVVAIGLALATRAHTARGTSTTLFAGGLLRADTLGNLAASLLVISCAAVTALVVLGPRRELPRGTVGLAGLALLGGLVVCQAAAVTGLYVGFELLGTAAVLAVGRLAGGRLGAEATAKLAVTWALGSVLLLWGLVWLAASAGSLDLDAIGAAILRQRHGALGRLPVLPSLLVLAGIAARMGTFPLGGWIADHARGSALVGVAFLGTLGPVAGWACLARLINPPALGEISDPMTLLAGAPALRFAVQVTAIVTILTAALLALGESRVARLLAWIGAAHIGIAALGTALAPVPGAMAGAWLALATQLLALPALALACHDVERRFGTDHMSSFAGLAREQPALGAALLIIVASSAALPLTPGFASRFLVFGAALEGGAIWLVALGLVTTALFFVPHLRLAWTLLAPPVEASDTRALPPGPPRGLSGIAVVSLTLAAITLAIGVGFGPLAELLEEAQRAGR